MFSRILDSRHQHGQGLVEYALILVLVAVVVIVILTLLGPQVRQVFCTVTVILGGEPDAGACGGDVVVITRAQYIPSGPKVHLEATSDGGYNPDATLTASPGGMMIPVPEENLYRLTNVALSGCPCTITITSSAGGKATVTVP